MFVSLFNFQGPLPLKERAFCILPHHRRFVNTFFSACPGFFPPHRFFLLAFLFKAALFLRSLHSLSVPLSKMLDHSIKPLPFCQYLFPPFSPSLYTPPRVARTTGTRTSTQNENQVKQKRSALLHFNYSVPLNYVLDITVSRRI